MSLQIYGKKSKKQYSAGYSGLHLVRWLAVVCCGLPAKDSCDNYTTEYVFRAPKDQGIMIDNAFVHAHQLSGMRFPNLLMHSDCDGGYTKEGKVMEGEGLLTGNSIGLLKELEIIKKETPKELQDKNQRIKKVDEQYQILLDKYEMERSVSEWKKVITKIHNTT